tara:strand:+ start:952 stop:1800 length:849 start_codon:yes stop_codon:yes gene_type:complete
MIRVLLPTDFSENALNAIYYALELLKNKECTFYLLNTYIPSSYILGSIPNNFSVLQMENIMQENSERRLKDIKKKLEVRSGKEFHQFKTISSFNILSNEINKITKSKNIDFIIMGTQGATGAAEIFIGTQTMYSIKKAKCPVLAIPESSKIEIPKNILFPTDFKVDRSNIFLSKLKQVCELNDANLFFLYVDHGSALSPDQHATKEWLHNYFQGFHPQFHFDMDIGLVEAVEKYQNKFNIQLLAMIHNKHNFFENLLFKPVVNQFAYHTKIPFLVLPSSSSF